MMNPRQKIFVFLLCAMMTVSLTAQQTQEDRQIGDFTGITVSAGIDVELTQGNRTSLRVSASDKVIDNVVTEVKGGTLNIRMKNSRSNWSWSKNNGEITVYVTFQDLERLNASGGSDVTADRAIRGDRMEIQSSGGSDIELEVDYRTMDCNSSGGSDLNLSGSVSDIVVTASGGSDVEAKGLQVSGMCELNASGGSDTHITANGNLDVVASGASDVYVYGNPSNIKQNSSGASDIHIR